MDLPANRIVLRPYCLSDGEAIHQWANDPETTRWMGPRFRNGRTKDEVLASLRRHVEGESEDGVFFAIADKASSDYLGGIDLTSIDRIDGNAVLSMVVARNSDRGRGIGTEAAGTLLRYAFGELRLHKVTLRVAEANTAALRCYAKLGFRQEGRLREHTRVDGRYYDMLLMGLLAREFKEL